MELSAAAAATDVARVADAHAIEVERLRRRLAAAEAQLAQESVLRRRLRMELTAAAAQIAQCAATAAQLQCRVGAAAAAAAVYGGQQQRQGQSAKQVHSAR